MKTVIKNLLALMLIALTMSCLEDKKTTHTEDSSVEKTSETETTKANTINIDKMKEKLCAEFPKELVLKYNPDATHIEIESIDNGAGGILHCNVKLFYGKKDYEYWKGQVAASINQMKDPFWQYNLERNATLYQKVDGFGEKAVFISNMVQLLILKKDVLYTIVPPNRGRVTSSGKENKEIAIEIAKHFNI